MPVRQQVLVLWLATSALDTPVVAWSFYDGASDGPTPPVGAHPTPPYATGVEALRDGWRLLQASPMVPPTPGDERRVSYLKHEFLFEKLVDTDADADADADADIDTDIDIDTDTDDRG